MLKNILNLEGAQQLSKNEQQSINGGWGACVPKCSSSCFCYKDGICYSDQTWTHPC